MSVSIAQKIKAYAVIGISRGHISSCVTVTNEGNAPIFGAESALSFILTDGGGNQVGCLRTDSPITDMTGPIPNGGSFEREAHFDTARLDATQRYTLTCNFDQTGDRDSATFSFSPLYLETPGAVPFAKH
jgi:hypothetical protein